MLLNLLKTLFKEIYRKNKISAIGRFFTYLLYILFLVYTYFSGKYIVRFTEKWLENFSFFEFFLTFFLFYLVLDFFIKTFFKKEVNFIPKILSVNPVSKKRIVNLFIYSNLHSKFDLFFIVFFISILYDINISFKFTFLITIYFAILLNSISAIFLKKVIQKKLIISLLPFISLIIFFVGLHIFDFNTLFSEFILKLLKNTYFIPVLPICFIIIFQVFKYYLLKNYNKLIIQQVNNQNNTNVKIFNRNSVLDFELKLLFRNSKTKYFGITTIIFFILANIFLLSHYTHTFKYFSFFWYSLISGIFVFNYGLYTFGFENSFLKLFFTVPNIFYNYINTKIKLFSISILLFYLICLPYFYYMKFNILSFTTFAFFNIGINQFLIILIAGLFKNKQELNDIFPKFNQISFIAYLIYPLVFLPVIIWFIISLFTENQYFISIILILISLLSLSFKRKWLFFIEKTLKRNKFKKIS